MHTSHIPSASSTDAAARPARSNTPSDSNKIGPSPNLLRIDPGSAARAQVSGSAALDALQRPPSPGAAMKLGKVLSGEPGGKDLQAFAQISATSNLAVRAQLPSIKDGILATRPDERAPAAMALVTADAIAEAAAFANAFRDAELWQAYAPTFFTGELQTLAKDLPAGKAEALHWLISLHDALQPQLTRTLPSAQQILPQLPMTSHGPQTASHLQLLASAGSMLLGVEHALKDCPPMHQQMLCAAMPVIAALGSQAFQRSAAMPREELAGLEARDVRQLNHLCLAVHRLVGSATSAQLAGMHAELRDKSGTDSTAEEWIDGTSAVRGFYAMARQMPPSRALFDASLMCWRDAPAAAEELMGWIEHFTASGDADAGHLHQLVQAALESQVWGAMQETGRNEPHPARQACERLLQLVQDMEPHLSDDAFAKLFTGPAVSGLEGLISQLPVMQGYEQAPWLRQVRGRLATVSPEVEKALAETRKKQELYISVDVEADGPIPGKNSMLSIGAAAFTADKRLVDTFSANLHTLKGAAPDEGTMKWWSEEAQRPAWEAHRKDLQAPEVAMQECLNWLKQLEGKPIFVGHPGAYDFMFVHWYLHNFTGKDPMGFAALDIKSYAMAVRQTGYKATGKSEMPQEWFDKDLPHTHEALADALEQGAMFINMRNAHLASGKGPYPAVTATRETGTSAVKPAPTVAPPRTGGRLSFPRLTWGGFKRHDGQYQWPLRRVRH